MKKVGLVGWRGMVGSVLMERMQKEHDFDHIEPVFAINSDDALWRWIELLGNVCAPGVEIVSTSILQLGSSLFIRQIFKCISGKEEKAFLDGVSSRNECVGSAENMMYGGVCILECWQALDSFLLVSVKAISEVQQRCFKDSRIVDVRKVVLDLEQW